MLPQFSSSKMNYSPISLGTFSLPAPDKDIVARQGWVGGMVVADRNQYKSTRTRRLLLPTLTCTRTITSSMASSQGQQIAVTDLDLTQLSDVRRQLEEVREFVKLGKTRY